MSLADDPPRAAGDLGDHLGPEALHDLVERALHGGKGREMLDQPIAALHGFARLDGIAVLIDDGPRLQIAVLVGIDLVKLRREGMGEIVQDIFARGDVAGKIAPFGRGDFREAALHQRFAGRDDLDHRGVARLQIAINRSDEARDLHRRDQMVEEALLVGFESRARGALGVAVIGSAALAGDVRGFQRCGQIIVNDLEGAGVSVIDADLLRRELVLQHLDLDPGVGQRARRIEAERLEIARQHLHGGDAASLHRRNKVLPRREGHVGRAPEPQARGVGEIGDGRRPGRRDIEDASVGQGVLQPQARPALLRGGLLAALALVANGVGEGVRLVEDDDAVEIRAQPVDDLRQARGLQRPVAALAFVRAQGRIGRKENTLGELDRRALLEARLRNDLQLLLAERRPVALRVLEQLVGFRNPERFAAAFEPIVEHDARDLAALPGAGAVAEIIAAAETHRLLGVVGRDGNRIEVSLTRKEPARCPLWASPA